MYNLHSINERSITLEAVDSTLADLAQEIIKWKAKHQNLQNLGYVSFQ
jgi:hypothetical protein